MTTHPRAITPQHATFEEFALEAMPLIYHNHILYNMIRDNYNCTRNGDPVFWSDEEMEAVRMKIEEAKG